MSSGFFYKTAEEKEKLVKAERKFIEDRVQKIIDLKDKVCAQSNKGFVVINQKVRKKFRFLTVCKYSSVFFQVWFVGPMLGHICEVKTIFIIVIIMPFTLCWCLQWWCKAVIGKTAGTLEQIIAVAPNCTSHHILYCHITHIQKGQFHLRLFWWNGKT